MGGGVQVSKVMESQLDQADALIAAIKGDPMFNPADPFGGITPALIADAFDVVESAERNRIADLIAARAERYAASARHNPAVYAGRAAAAHYLAEMVRTAGRAGGR